MINAKAKGARNERKIRDHYLAIGCHVVKAGGSLGLFDLVALHPDHGCLLIQVKSNRPPRPAEREALANFQCHASWRKIICVCYDRQSPKFYDI